MKATDQIRPDKCPCYGAFSNRGSFVNLFFVAFRVMVLFAVGIGRRSIWSGRKSAGAARSTTG